MNLNGTELKGLNDALEFQRGYIDSIDDQIVALLEERAQVVLNIREIKLEIGKNFIQQSREREILDRLRTRINHFPESALRVIYAAIFGAMVELQLGEDKDLWKVERLSAKGFALKSGDRILIAVPTEEVERLNTIAALHNGTIQNLIGRD